MIRENECVEFSEQDDENSDNYNKIYHGHLPGLINKLSEIIEQKKKEKLEENNNKACIPDYLNPHLQFYKYS